MFRFSSILSVGVLAIPDVEERFHSWVEEQQKEYGSDNMRDKALANFAANEDMIKKLNEDDFDLAEYGHTRFSDLSPREFRTGYLSRTGMDPSEARANGIAVDVSTKGTPEAFDWRESGAVTPVRDQTSCGSCWAESAIGNMESVWYLANKNSMNGPVPLSVEQVIECDPYDYACYGGYPKGAYQYAIDSDGLAAEADYPYAVDGHTICLANQTFNATCGDGICDDPPLTSSCDLTCSAKSHKIVAKISSWVALPTDEDKIAAYLAQSGPVSVGIDAKGGIIGVLFPWLQFYKKGIANPRGCKNEELSKVDHGVLLVGYGVDAGTKYWVVKNSWGPKWGENGYFRLIRGEAKCAINLMATAAVAATHEIVV